jgi:hypothetical protein
VHSRDESAAVPPAPLPAPVAPAPAEGSNGNPTPGSRYPLCHATGSATHPYVAIEVALPAIRAGHAGHDDIIPPIPGYTEGANWTEATIAVFENGCELPETMVGQTATTMDRRALATEPAPSATSVPTAGAEDVPQAAASDPSGSIALAFTGGAMPWSVVVSALGLGLVGTVLLLLRRDRAALLPREDASQRPRA